MCQDKTTHGIVTALFKKNVSRRRGCNGVSCRKQRKSPMFLSFCARTKMKPPCSSMNLCVKVMCLSGLGASGPAAYNGEHTSCFDLVLTSPMREREGCPAGEFYTERCCPLKRLLLSSRSNCLSCSCPILFHLWIKTILGHFCWEGQQNLSTNDSLG